MNLNYQHTSNIVYRYNENVFSSSQNIYAIRTVNLPLIKLSNHITGHVNYLQSQIQTIYNVTEKIKMLTYTNFLNIPRVPPTATSPPSLNTNYKFSDAKRTSLNIRRLQFLLWLHSRTRPMQIWDASAISPPRTTQYCHYVNIPSAASSGSTANSLSRISMIANVEDVNIFISCVKIGSVASVFW